MKLFPIIYAFLVSAIPVCAELPTGGFRAVSGGGSPDGRWIVCVLDSSETEFVDQLPKSHQSPYLVDLEKMSAVTKFADVTTLGGYHGRPELNVTSKWFPDSKHVSIAWRVGRLNHHFSLFEVSPAGTLRKMKLPDPLKLKESIFTQLEAHSNCGKYLESITPDGELVVVYYGFLPKEEAFYKTEEGKTFDRNRIEVVFTKNRDEWVIKSVAGSRSKGARASAGLPISTTATKSDGDEQPEPTSEQRSE